MEFRNKRALKKAKFELLFLLVELQNEITDEEKQIMFALLDDPQVQEKIKQAFVKDITLEQVLKLACENKGNV
jgi:hypothetical protein